MKNQKRIGILVGLAVSLLSLVIYSCTRSGPCEGSLTLENPIPDITVAVGDTVLIDLTDPPVFVSSEGKVTFDYLINKGNTNANLSIIPNPNDEQNFTLLLVIGDAPGEAVAELKAYSDCLENSTTFNINVTKISSGS